MPDETRAIEPADEPNGTDPLADNPGAPYAFIQWKNTDACLDIYCECGAQGHIDDYFCYSVQCRNCGKIWQLAHYVRLYPNGTGDDEAVDPKPFGDDPHPAFDSSSAPTYETLNRLMPAPTGFDAEGKVKYD